MIRKRTAVLAAVALLTVPWASAQAGFHHGHHCYKPGYYPYVCYPPGYYPNLEPYYHPGFDMAVEVFGPGPYYPIPTPAYEPPPPVGVLPDPMVRLWPPFPPRTLGPSGPVIVQPGSEAPGIYPLPPPGALPAVSQAPPPGTLPAPRPAP